MPDLPEKLQNLDREVMELTRPCMERIDGIADENQVKVLNAFIRNRVASHHLGGSTGYGYGDIGRDTLDRVFADAVGAGDALCRVQFLNGTHALSTALFGILRPGDTLLSATGRPYDTLSEVIGLGEGRYGSLAEFGVHYAESGGADRLYDTDDIARKAKEARLIYIQRSRGYAQRKALSCREISEIAAAAKGANPDVIVLVDNCYGEFTETKEPVSFGADLIAGSLIKNPGGAIAETGGYIAGRKDLVELCAHRLTVPGSGREIGCTPSGLRSLYLGLYLAPGITAQALKSAVYACALFERLGYAVSPRFDETRSDIITAISLGSPEAVVAFCQAIQAFSPVDSFVKPEPWEMPGYDDPVIMAAGTFTGGASIELSCDAPMRPPYTVYLQGGISLAASRYAFLKAAQSMTSL